LGCLFMTRSCIGAGPYQSYSAKVNRTQRLDSKPHQSDVCLRPTWKLLIVL